MVLSKKCESTNMVPSSAKLHWNKPTARGAETRGGWGIYPPNNLTVPPNNLSMVYICIPSNNLTLVCIWGRSPPEFGEKKCSIQ